MMNEAPEILINDAVRRQVLLEGVKESEWKNFASYLKKIELAILERLLNEGDTIRTRKRLNSIVKDLQEIQSGIYDGYFEELVSVLDEVALLEAELESETLGRTVIDFEAEKPSNEQILTAYKKNFLSIDGQSFDLAPFLKDFKEKQISMIQSAINQGFIQGKTISDIVKDVRGTRIAGFNNGKIAKINRNDRALVRTAIQNASAQAKERVWRSNQDVITSVEWVSTLDSRTSAQCRTLDGEIFPVDEGPRPPIHYGCRSTTAPVLSEGFDYLRKGAKRPAIGSKGAGQVAASSTYYSWLKKQPASFQDSVIGKKRGLLLRNGGLTSEEFSDLQLNSTFQPITLEQMRKQAPEAFEKANL